VYQKGRMKAIEDIKLENDGEGDGRKRRRDVRSV
jgi:hypothetical protein